MNKPVFVGLFFLIFQTSVYAVSHENISSSDRGKYGQTLVAEFDIPLDQVRKFNQLVIASSDNKEPNLEKFKSTVASSEDWLADVVHIDSRKNPYRMVLTLSGTAVSSADVQSAWAVGWRQTDGLSHLIPMAGLIKRDVQAGEEFVLTEASASTSFKENQVVFPTISFLKAQNLVIKSVHVQVWSGAANASWMDVFLSMRWFLVALLVIGLGWSFKRV